MKPPNRDMQPLAAQTLFDDPTELLHAIIVAARECKDPYAQAYINALPLAADEFGEQGVSVQLLYCLNSMAGWRGERARETKRIFKKWAVILARKPSSQRLLKGESNDSEQSNSTS